MSAYDTIARGIDEKDELLRKAELALRHSLTSTLGAQLVPLPGNEKDRQAVAILRSIEIHNGRPS